MIDCSNSMGSESSMAKIFNFVVCKQVHFTICYIDFKLRATEICIMISVVAIIGAAWHLPALAGNIKESLPGIATVQENAPFSFVVC